MSLRRLILFAIAVPLLAACVRTETVTGTILYPPGVNPDAPGTYGTEAQRPAGAVSKSVPQRPRDPYQQAMLCAASQAKLLRLDSYMVTRGNLNDMQDAVDTWTDVAIERGGAQGLSERQVRDDISQSARALPGREADRLAGGCVGAS